MFDSLNDFDRKASDIPRRPHKRPSYPHLWAFMCASPGANIGEKYERMLSDIAAFKNLFATQCSKDFAVVPAFPFTFFGAKIKLPDDSVFTLDAGQVNTKDPLSVENVKKLYDYVKKWDENRDRDPNTNNIPPSSIIIMYVSGDYIENDGFTTGYAFGNELPYLIFLTNKASSNTFAHEVGHVLNYSNKNGPKDDPDPASPPDKPSHNKNEGNLMYKEAGNTITQAQCAQFSESKIILRSHL